MFFLWALVRFGNFNETFGEMHKGFCGDISEMFS